MSTAEFRQYTAFIDRKISDVTNLVDHKFTELAGLIAGMRVAAPASITPSSSHIEPTDVQKPNQISIVSVTSSQSGTCAALTSAFTHSEEVSGKRSVPAVPQATIPDLPKKHKNAVSTAWKTAIMQWLEGDPQAGLDTPLKDWPDSWHEGAMSRFTGTKYHQRRKIALEYER